MLDDARDRCKRGNGIGATRSSAVGWETMVARSLGRAVTVAALFLVVVVGDGGGTP